MSLGDWAENALLDWLLGGSSPSRPSARYVSLHTADPGDNGANELTGTGYARPAVTFGAASSGVASNSATATFSNSGGTAWAEATHFGIWTLASGGSFLGSGSLSVARAIAAGTSATFAAGDLDATLS